MGVLDEHPAEDCSKSLPRRQLAPNALGSQALDEVADPWRDGRVPTLPHHLDGTPNPPTPPDDPVGPKPQRKGKVTELKKAFERGLSGLVRKRQTTESREEGADRVAVAKHPTAIDTSSPEDNFSKGSLFCSPLPKTKRREPNVPSSPLKDKISIFEGLVKPSSSSPLTTGNTASFVTGDKILESGHNEPTSRLPSKFPGAPAAAQGSPKQLRTLRKESAEGNSQGIGQADPPGFLRRLSSTFKHKHKPSHLAGARSSRADFGAEEERTQRPSRVLQSTPTSQKHSQSEKRRISAADSLRKRLESDLRPGASTNVPRETQADESTGGKQRHDSLMVSQDDKPAIVSTRRKTTLWDIENPFDVPKAKDRGKSEATGGRLETSGEGCSGHTESNDFSKVALAHISFSQDTPRQKASASRYVELTELPEPHNTQSSNRTDSTSGQAEDGSDHSGSSNIVVVAKADCELTHPRPSRSSDKKMIKVLCKCGRETGEEKDGTRQDSLASVSGGSSASFHTAPVSTSVC